MGGKHSAFASHKNSFKKYPGLEQPTILVLAEKIFPQQELAFLRLTRGILTREQTRGWRSKDIAAGRSLMCNESSPLFFFTLQGFVQPLLLLLHAVSPRAFCAGQCNSSSFHSSRAYTPLWKGARVSWLCAGKVSISDKMF